MTHLPETGETTASPTRLVALFSLYVGSHRLGLGNETSQELSFPFLVTRGTDAIGFELNSDFQEI